MGHRKQFWRALFFIFLITVLCGGMALPVLDLPARAAPRMQVVTHIVISQVYGGGGNSGATYTNDYVELFNPSDSPISVNGWSIQYTGATGTSWQVTPLTNVSIAAGQYYLVQLAGGANGSPLPVPDATGTVNMSASAGKVALVTNATALSGSGCPFDVSVVDFVGYGTAANCREGSGNAPAPSNTTADIRNSSGCFDSNNNDVDFVAGAPNPRNTTFGLAVTCSSLLTATEIANQTGTANANATGTESSNQTSTAFVANQTGTAIANLTGTASAVNATGTAAVPTNTPTNTSSAPRGNVVISEFRAAGPNGGNDEFVELYNRSQAAVSIGNWIIKKSTGCGTSVSTVANISGGVTLAPGQHYLIGGNTYSGSVTPDQANVPLSLAADGGIALFKANGVTIVDQVGMCATTLFHEGTALAPLSGNTNRSYDRKPSASGICRDSNNNVADFIARSPSDPQNSSSRRVCANPTLTPTTTRTPTITRTLTRTRTPSRTPTPPPPPPLIAINEFVPRPGHDWNGDGVVNVGDEFIELLNHGVIDVNLSGYTLDDEVNIGSTPFRLPSVTLSPGERIVFYGSQTNLLLSDGGDGVRLIKPNGQLGDAYNYRVVRFPDQSYCRLPDNGGLDDWNQDCFPTPGLQNSLRGTVANPPVVGSGDLCPIADTLPNDFVLAECPPFGNNIWNSRYWDTNGWFDQRFLPKSPGKWDVFVD